MLHPAQRICCKNEHLFYAIGSSVYSYSVSDEASILLWSAEPITAAEKLKNIEHRAVSEITVHGNFLVWIAEDKILRVYDLEQTKLVSERELVKRGCAIFQTHDTIIIGDKFGDVYTYPLDLQAPNGDREDSLTRTNQGIETLVENTSDSGDKQEKLPILGHVSMLTAITLTPDSADSPGRYIISSDRDEHIRVSSFPDGENIEAYCLGHTQFVSALLIPSKQPDVLVSAGGDEYLAFWQWRTGKQLERRAVPEMIEFAKSQGHGLAVVKMLELPIEGADKFVVLLEGLSRLFVLSFSDTKDVITVDLLAPAIDISILGHQLFISYDTSTATDSDIRNFEALDLTDRTLTRRLNLDKLNNDCKTITNQVQYTVHKVDLMRKRTKTELEEIRLSSPANKQKEKSKKRPRDSENVQ